MLSAVRRYDEHAREGAAKPRPHHRQPTDEILNLQSKAGNAAVSRSLTQDRPVLQRDIGFEFEDRYFRTRQLGRWRFMRVRKRLPQMNLQDLKDEPKLEKNTTLLDRADVALKTDDSGSESDGEFVTDPFPETEEGKARLNQAFSAMKIFEDRLRRQPHAPICIAELAGNSFEVRAPRAIALPQDLPSKGFRGGPQMTMGLGLKNIPTFIDDLVGRVGQQSHQQLQERRPGRLLVRPGTGAQTPVLDAAGGLVRGVDVANQAIRAYSDRVSNRVPEEENGIKPSDELRGLLALIYSITESAPNLGAYGFLKATSGLLAKTDYASLFKSLPEDEKRYLSERAPSDSLAKYKFGDLVASAPTYSEYRFLNPVFETGSAKKRFVDEVGVKEKDEWYLNLTLRNWVSGIVEGVDQLTTARFPDLPRGKDLEGFGVLGEKTDTVGNQHLPILEFRSMTGVTTIREFHPVAIKLFDYVTSLNRDRRQAIT